MNKFRPCPGWSKAWFVSIAAPFLVTPVVAQNEPGADESEPIEEIVITGSRIPRAGFDTLQPAIVVDAQFLKERGFTDVATALNELPAFGAPGANSTQGDQSSYSIGQNFVNLYGIGSQRTLTLVNGRRFVSSSSPSLFVDQAAGLQVDLNQIPTALVERIETIGIGGAPIYGADAVAGTVNVIMKKDFEGLDLAGTYGISDASEMEETTFNITWGTNSSDGRGNVVVSLEHTDRAGMIESDMEHLRKGWQFRDTDDDTYDTTLVTPGVANIVSAGGVITPDDIILPNIGLGAWGAGEFLQFGPDGSLVDYDVGSPVNNIVWSVGGDGLFLPDVTGLFTPIKRTMVTTFANYEVADSVNMFGEFWAGRSEATQLIRQPAYQSGLFSNESFALFFPVDHPLLSTAARDRLATTIDPNTGLPATGFWMHRSSTDLTFDDPQESTNDLLRGVIGLEGEFAAGDRDVFWDFSYNRGRSSATQTSADIDSKRFFYALDVVDDGNGGVGCRVTVDPSSRPADPADPFGTGLQSADYDDCVPLDLFGAGRPSAEAIAYISVQTLGKTVVEQEVWQANIGADLFELPAGPFAGNIGWENRTESASFEVDGFTELGLGRSVPVNGIAGEYTSNEFYAEFYAPIVSDDMDIPIVANLDLEGSWRSMDNDFAGQDDAWTIGLRYMPVDDIEFRGNVTRSVRAPAITELFLPLSGTNSFASDPCDGTFVNEGPDPATRRANCIAGGGGLPGIPDPDNFVSSVRNASVQGRTGGNLGLSNEQADAWTAGFILRPRWVDGLQIAIDYINIDLEDAIESFSLTDIMRSCYDAVDFPNEFCSSFRRQPNGQLPASDAFVSGYVNAGERTFKAWTAEVLYSFDALNGQFDLFGSLINIKEDVETILGTSTDYAGEAGQSEWQANFSFRYSRDTWSALLQPRFIGEAVWDKDASPTRYSVPGFDNTWIVNGSFRYDVTEKIAVQLNINNLFDELPPPAAIATGYDGIFDNIGRYYRLRFDMSL